MLRLLNLASLLLLSTAGNSLADWNPQLTIRNETGAVIYDIRGVSEHSFEIPTLASGEEVTFPVLYSADAQIEWTEPSGSCHVAVAQLPGRAGCGESLFFGSVIRVRGSGASGASSCWHGWETYEQPD